MFHGWIVLLVSLPPRPSSLRVRAWRRLRGLGALGLKGGAYLLPASAEHDERIQWLAQEIRRDGGEALVLRVERIENLADGDLAAQFQAARDREYAGVALRYRKLARGRRRPRPDELAGLGREMERLARIDFFDAPGRREAQRAREAAERRLADPEARGPAAPGPRLDRQVLRGRRWVTRPRPHVDRIASAWLIKRFLDPEAEFVFATEATIPAEAVPFDMPGVELGHRGEDCTFETLLRGGELSDRRLAALAEIVHEADLRDGKFSRDEAPGLDLVLRGLLEAVEDDHEALRQGMVIMDGLYAAMREQR